MSIYAILVTDLMSGDGPEDTKAFDLKCWQCGLMAYESIVPLYMGKCRACWGDKAPDRIQASWSEAIRDGRFQ